MENELKWIYNIISLQTHVGSPSSLISSSYSPAQRPTPLTTSTLLLPPSKRALPTEQWSLTVNAYLRTSCIYRVDVCLKTSKERQLFRVNIQDADVHLQLHDWLLRVTLFSLLYSTMTRSFLISWRKKEMHVSISPCMCIAKQLRPYNTDKRLSKCYPVSNHKDRYHLRAELV